MKKIKVSKAFIIIATTGLLLILALLAGAVYLTFFSSTNHYFTQEVKLDTVTGLNKQQRNDDFEELCEYIEKNIPTLYEYENLYGISYDEIKAYYKDSLKNVNSDFEYYAFIMGFLNNIPSAHLSAYFPSISNIDSVFAEYFVQNKSFTEAQDYWFEVIHNECKKYYDTKVDMMRFAYYSGEYRGIAEDVENDVYGINRAVLLSVNNIDVNEFIKVNSLINKLKYDHVNNRPFRDVIYFNNYSGEECIVEYINEKGEKCTQKMYYGAVADLALAYDGVFKKLDENTADETDNEKNNTEKTESYFDIYKDDNADVLYVCIDSFVTPEKYGENYITYGEEIKRKIIKSSEGIDNIIIDLRDNAGGQYDNAKAVFSALSNKELKVSSDLYITKYFYDTENFKPEYKFYFDDELGLYKANISETINGIAPETKKIYLLISDNTGSAADNFTWDFKQNKLGTIIGANNTSGEQKGSVCYNFNEISGIYYSYTPYAAMNSDKDFSSVCGTAPDVYINKNIESYFIRTGIQKSGEDPYTYENRLKWDNVLIETLEIIKEKETTEK